MYVISLDRAVCDGTQSCDHRFDLDLQLFSAAPAGVVAPWTARISARLLRHISASASTMIRPVLPCYVEGSWVDSSGGIFRVHQQETWFTVSHTGWDLQQFATVQPDLSFRSTGPLGVTVHGVLRRSPESLTPPTCAWMDFRVGSNVTTTWCNLNARVRCPTPRPSPPPPRPPTLGLRPYPLLSANLRGSARLGSRWSPDPLVNATWPGSTPADQMQLYFVPSTNITCMASPEAFDGSLQSLVGGHVGSARVHGNGSVRITFGAEFAGWIELEAADLPAGASLWLGVSEDNQPHTSKLLQPHAHAGEDGRPNGTVVYRLETNRLVYEGVRFGFVFVNTPAGSTWHITRIRGVGQSLPVVYASSFDALDDSELTRVWWTGAYCPKLNMAGPPLPGARAPSTLMLNAVLVDRGDRIGWTGDDHVAQGAILTAFGAARHEFVRQSLWNTHNDSNAIPAFSLMWCLSVVDYFLASADGGTLRSYALNVDAKVAYAASIEGSASQWGAAGPWVAPSLAFVGWDERLGAGFEYGSWSNESQRVFSMLTARTAREFARALRLLNATDLLPLAARHEQIYKRIAAATPSPLAGFGMHATSEAILASIVPPHDYAALLAAHFERPAQLCSLAPYNNYFVLRALGKLSLPRAVEMVRLCWGGQLALGATTFWEVCISPSSPAFSAFTRLHSPSHAF